MNRQKYFYEEFVIGLGFASGFWSAIGINPEAVIFDSLLSLIKTDVLMFRIIFYLIPLMVTIVAMLGAYKMGGEIGIVGVVVAFFGGLIILPPYTFAGMILVLIGAELGKSGVDSVMSHEYYV